MRRFTLMSLSLALFCTIGVPVRHAQAEDETVFSLYPIGVVKKHDKKTEIVVDQKQAPGLLGLDGFSHVIVFYWFDKNDTPQKRSVLQVHPRGNKQNPLTGVFATRSPARPNLVAMSVCKILSVKGNVIEVDTIDAFADSPVLDLKPYIPKLDLRTDATVPAWVMKMRKKK